MTTSLYDQSGVDAPAAIPSNSVRVSQKSGGISAAVSSAAASAAAARESAAEVGHVAAAEVRHSASAAGPVHLGVAEQADRIIRLEDGKVAEDSGEGASL